MRARRPVLSLPLHAWSCGPAGLGALQLTIAIPIVFANAVDPVGKGFEKLIQYLAQLVPGLSRLAFLTSFDSVSGAGGASGPAFVEITTSAAKALAIQLKFLDVNAYEDVDPALAEALGWQVQAMIMTGIPFTDPTPTWVRCCRME